MTSPEASRPHMPGYGIAGPNESGGLLPWAWAEERLLRSHDYWLATVRPDGAPHVMPVWAVWAQGAAWFSSSGASRKTRNLAADARAVITTDDPLHPVVVEGVATRVVDPEAIARFAHWVNTKYETDYPDAFFTENACFCLTPATVFSLDEANFAGSPTRWTFEPGV